MAAAIRFTKAERELLVSLIESMRAPHNDYAAKDLRTADGVLEKLEKSELVKGKGHGPGLSYSAIMNELRGVLGGRLIPPIGAVIGWLVNRVNLLRLSEAQLRHIATVAGQEWNGKIKAESVVRSAERFLTLDVMDTPTFQGHGGPENDRPVEMDEL